MDSLYYRINRKSNFILFEDLAMQKTRSALTTELDNTADKSLDQKMDIIFNTIISKFKPKEREKEKDKLEIILTLIEQYRKLKKINIKDNLLSQKMCQIISLENYTTSFSFKSKNMNEVATLLFFGFKKLKRKYNNYNNFLTEIQSYMGKYYDLIRSYQLLAKGNEDIKIKEYDIPNEFLILLEAFKNVKTIKISLEDSFNDSTNESVITYLLILLNHDWLFPCVFDLDLNLSCYKLNQEVMNIYKKKFNKYYSDFLNSDEYTDSEIIDKILEKIKTEKEEANTKKDKSAEKNKSNSKAEKEAKKLEEKKTREFNEMLTKIYPTMIKNNGNIFDVMLLLVNFIKKLSFINRLIINIPDGYNIEINDYLFLKGVPNIQNIQYVDFLATINNLRELDVKFNSMEAMTFEKILYMIKNNRNLKTLKLNFFPDEKEYFSTYQLLKIEENNFLREMSKKNFINKNPALNGLSIYDDIKDEQNLRKKAMDNLQKSLENFFVLIQMMEKKSNLESLTLEMNKPFNLIDKNLFWILLKLFFNILLEFNRELLNLKEFIFICPYFNLDNSYYSFIETFFNVINLNNKNKEMNYFHLKCQLSNIPNLSSLISFNLTKLSIGDLDLISFKNLVSFLHSNEFVENSKLKKLSIYLSKEIVVFRECQDEINNLIVGENPESLIELNLSCHFNISHDNLIEIMTKANGNGIELYNFIMEMVSENDYMNVFKGTKFYYSNKKYISCIDKYLPLLVKFKFLEKDKINISKRLLKFLLPSNRKKIIFKKIA